MKIDLTYCNAQDVRDILGVEIDDAPDNIINKYITKAQKVVMKHIQVPIINEGMSGNIDGINSTFTAENPFFADTDGSLSINTLDFTVYLWPDEADEFSKVRASISTFNPETGAIILTSAPTDTGTEKITIDYSYYTCKIDWDLVTLATSYYAAMMYVGREFYLVPERVFIGELRLQRTKGEPWETLRREFRRVIDLLVAAPMTKIDYEKMVINPRTTTEQEDSDQTLFQQLGLT